MKAYEVFQELVGRKGQHVKITWQRSAKLRKGTDHLVFKRTTAHVRAGINYSNLTDIREGIEKGTREPVEGLPWGVWREGFQNFIIDNGEKEYIRLYPASFDNLKPQVTWLLDGREVEYAEVEPYLLASEKPKTHEEKSACFNVNAADIITVAD